MWALSCTARGHKGALAQIRVGPVMYGSWAQGSAGSVLSLSCTTYEREGFEQQPIDRALCDLSSGPQLPGPACAALANLSSLPGKFLRVLKD